MERIIVKGGLALRDPVHWSECPYCRRPVGVIGNWIAVLVGVGFHKCDFRNVMHPQELEARLERIAAPSSGTGR